MNILFIGYWSFNDGLSLSTIKPHLQVLSDFKRVKEIYYVSFERSREKVTFDWNIPKVIHIPVLSPPFPLFLDKIIEFWRVPYQLERLVKLRGIDLIMCRSSMAGIYGYKIWKKRAIPYTVESFEPHADYMRVSGVWKKSGIRYRLQKYFEERQKQTAKYILPLTIAYKNNLKEEGLEEERLLVLPCAVDIDKYKFRADARTSIRKKLGLEDSRRVGIYVGKKGGIYYDKEIFILFKSLSMSFKNIFFMILTPQDALSWESEFKKVGIKKNDFVVTSVPHELVTEYLSAADFAFNFHRSSEVSLAFSPIKNREYWANGLPIVMGQNIGDDSSEVSERGTGIIIDYKNCTIPIGRIKFLLNRDELVRNMKKDIETSTRCIYEKIIDG